MELTEEQVHALADKLADCAYWQGTFMEALEFFDEFGESSDLPPLSNVLTVPEFETANTVSQEIDRVERLELAFAALAGTVEQHAAWFEESKNRIGLLGEL